MMFIMLCVSLSEAQIQKGYYQFNQDELIGSPQINDADGVAHEIYEGYRIKVVKITANPVVIYYRYVPFHSTKQTYTRKFGLKTNKKTVASPLAAKFNGKLFRMSETNFEFYTDPVYSRFKGVDVGVYTVPFRLRDIGGKYFDFESSLSLQSNLIFGFGRTTKAHSWFDFSIGIGLTGVTIDSLNSNLPASDGSRSASAFTVSTGFVFKPTPFVNFGVFIGTDLLGLKDRSTGWVYNGKPWVGVGVNISFNRVDTDKSAKIINAEQMEL